MKRKVFKVSLRIKSRIKEKMFGSPARGIKLSKPSFHTVYPDGQGPDRDTSFPRVVEWVEEIGATKLSDKRIVHID